MPESGWVTHREAAELLGVHVSAVPKIVRRGDLTPRDRRPSLSRDQVVAPAAHRAAAAAELERRRASPPSGPQPPDDEHDWLRAPAAASVLGCTKVALYGRSTRGQVPYVVHAGRRWYPAGPARVAGSRTGWTGEAGGPTVTPVNGGSSPLGCWTASPAEGGSTDEACARPLESPRAEPFNCLTAFVVTHPWPTV